MFIIKLNLGLSGKNENVIVLTKLIKAIEIMNNLHGTKFMKKRLILKLNGIIRIADIEEYTNVTDINIAVNEAALGAVSFV